MAEKIAAKTAEDAFQVFLCLRKHKPFRFAGMKWMARIDDETFVVRSTKPKKQSEVYKIEANP